MMGTLGARLEALAAALLFSTGGAAIKATTLTNWQVASFRCGVAALAIALFIPASRRNWNRQVPLVALFYAATLAMFVLATKLTTAANAIFLQSTAPLYLLAAGPFILKERARRVDYLFILILAIGLACFFIGEETPSGIALDPVRGNFLAALTGMTWAGTLGGLRWIQNRHPGVEVGLPTILCGNLMAFLFCLTQAVPVRSSTPLDWSLILYLGLIQVGLAYVLLSRAVKRLPALETSILLLSEPAMNPIWTWLVHGETPGPWAIGGGLLILGATAGRLFTRLGR
ncbi:MAG: DMT family transporter [Bryobacteraceae bacterium]